MAEIWILVATVDGGVLSSTSSLSSSSLIPGVMEPVRSYSMRL